MNKQVFQVGARVRIKPEFCDKRENAADVCIVRENNGDRLYIAPEVWDYPIVPVELVRDYMLEPVRYACGSCGGQFARHDGDSCNAEHTEYTCQKCKGDK